MANEKLGPKQTPVYTDRSGKQLPLIAIRRHPVNPDELVNVEYMQLNGMPRTETVYRPSLERLIGGVDKV